MTSRMLGIICLLCLHSVAGAQGWQADDSEGPIIIYLHGQIIESEGPTPTHPRWGLYDYPAVLSALASRGARVDSEERARGTNVYEYAGVVINQIERLIMSGVAPERIVVVGFSKGGAIMIHVSSFLRRSEIRYVPLAACSSWLENHPQLRLTGHVFSVYEKSDELASSCANFDIKNNELKSFLELRVNTGKEHGAFYLPRDEWLNPVLDWIHGTDDQE